MAYLSKDVAFVSHSLSLCEGDSFTARIYPPLQNKWGLEPYTCICVCVNIYALLIVIVMQPLCSKYRWGSMWPLKKKTCEYFLVDYLLIFVVCAKAFAMDAVILTMLLLVVQRSHWLNYFYSTSCNWIGMVDFRNIPQFLGNKEIWETLIIACRIVYPNTNITNGKEIQKSTTCAL